MPDLMTRFRDLAAACDDSVFGHPIETPGQILRRLADLADELGVSWDQYGARGPVARLEEELEALFGKPAAFFPSGVMAQQSALRVWCDRAGTSRVAMPDLSHLLVHEQDGPRRLHGFQVEHLTTSAEVATASALHEVVGQLGAALVELPLRDAGCLLPTWHQLTDLSAAARERGVPLHFDGARIWESQPFWGTSLAEIAALSDSMYVSFYKGLRGLAGAALIGPEDFLAEARVWRTRMGGTLYRSTPEALAALLGLRELLPRMGECLAWARALAAELPAVGITPPTRRAAHPDVPAPRQRSRGRGQRTAAPGDGARAAAVDRSVAGVPRAGADHHRGGRVHPGSGARTPADRAAARRDRRQLTVNECAPLQLESPVNGPVDGRWVA